MNRNGCRHGSRCAKGVFNLPKVGQRGKSLPESVKEEERVELEGAEPRSSPVPARSSPKRWMPDGCPAARASPAAETQVPQRPTSRVAALRGLPGSRHSSFAVWWLFPLSGNGIAGTACGNQLCAQASTAGMSLQ